MVSLPFGCLGAWQFGLRSTWPVSRGRLRPINLRLYLTMNMCLFTRGSILSHEFRRYKWGSGTHSKSDKFASRSHCAKII